MVNQLSRRVRVGMTMHGDEKVKPWGCSHQCSGKEEGEGDLEEVIQRKEVKLWGAGVEFGVEVTVGSELGEEDWSNVCLVDSRNIFTHIHTSITMHYIISSSHHHLVHCPLEAEHQHCHSQHFTDLTTTTTTTISWRRWCHSHTLTIFIILLEMTSYICCNLTTSWSITWHHMT